MVSVTPRYASTTTSRIKTSQRNPTVTPSPALMLSTVFAPTPFSCPSSARLCTIRSCSSSSSSAQRASRIASAFLAPTPRRHRICARSREFTISSSCFVRGVKLGSFAFNDSETCDVAFGCRLCDFPVDFGPYPKLRAGSFSPSLGAS